jgi:glycosyltransferase involved in cell wall biosynthesis
MQNRVIRSQADDPERDRVRDLCSAYLALQAQARSNQLLRGEIAAMKASHSWRITEPLRRFRHWLHPTSRAVPPLQPADRQDAADPLRDATELLVCRAVPGGALANPASQRPQQLLVDVTELAREDLGAGVQRVVHRILVELILDPPPGFRIEPVRISDQGHYVRARSFLAQLIGLPADAVGADGPVRTAPGDQFLGLDLVRDQAGLVRDALLAMKASGVSIAFVVFDVLPLQRPDWFPDGLRERFRLWLRVVAECADQALCISESVCADLREALAAESPASKISIASFPLGADLDPWLSPIAGLPGPKPGTARFLMVGTVEVRKGHAQALEAFEHLWRDGVDCELLIAGNPGWLVSELIDRLRSHPEAGRRLHWMQGVGDASLLAAYRDSTALLAPSWGEGFGLPLVEAAANGLPILARDIPVFREVAGRGADFFRGESGAELAAAIQDWLQRWRAGNIADPLEVSLSSWRESAGVLKTLLLRDL